MLANSSARPMRPSGTSLAARRDVVLERDPGLGRGLHMLVGLDEANQQGVDQHVVRRAFVRDHLGQRHAGGARDRGRRAACARRLGADVEHVDDAASGAISSPGRPAAWSRMAANSFRSRSCCRSSSVISSNGPVAEVPALFTRTSIWPNVFHHLVMDARNVGRLGDISGEAGERALWHPCRPRRDGLDRASRARALRWRHRRRISQIASRSQTRCPCCRR